MASWQWTATTVAFQAVVFCALWYLLTEVEHLVLRTVVELCAFATSFCIGFMSLFSVSIFSNDLAYLLVRCVVPDHEVWHYVNRRRRAVTWLVLWGLQAPLWAGFLASRSALLVHEQVSFVLAVYHVALKRYGIGLKMLPSTSIIGVTETSPRRGLSTHLFARFGLPLAYVVCNGLPDDWKQVLGLMSVGVFILIARLIAQFVGIWPRHSDIRKPWELEYPPQHGAIGEDLTEDDDCSEHGTCAICLSNLCCPGGGSLLGRMVQTVSHRASPGLAVARLRSSSAAASLSVSRSSCNSLGGRIAITRCGHHFHAECLAKAAETLNRCPQCRSGLGHSSHELQIPDEDTIEEQLLSLLGVFLLGACVMLVYLMGRSLSKYVLNFGIPLLSPIR
eukprot:TRINITY_DN37671_c0_g1_i1.p1 TRINITY_DN37671_c0_g1~~TRINITY_DN37671_c0_g1_i1.p1  ORF type:complete len:391 (+),score=25.83 TRINITY_DN37671_c0_g1_i1:51-1223(+)